MHRFIVLALLRAPLLMLGLLLTAAFPTDALAATASASFQGEGFQLKYEAAPGEVNQVEASVREDGTARIHDSGAVIFAKAGCFSVDDHTVECPNTVLGVLILGDGDDSYSTVGVAHLEVLGGPGADALSSCVHCWGALQGGAGDDRLMGRSIMGGSGNDALTGTGWPDFIDGEPGNDVITAGAARDYITAGIGDDVIDAGAGEHDLLIYTDVPGPVTVNLRTGISTGAGTDTFSGVEGVAGSLRGDMLIGDEKANSFLGLAGQDVMRGGAGADRLYGREGKDVLKGEEGNDFLVGGVGRDWLFAGPGDDFLGSRDHCRDKVRGQQGRDRARVDWGLDSVLGVEKLI